MIVYKITNCFNGMSYIGITRRSLAWRWNKHCSPAPQNCKRIWRAIKKYGKNNFNIEVLASAKTLKQLNDLEIKFIQIFNTKSPNGYNLTLGGGSYEFQGPTKPNSKSFIKGHKGFKNSANFKPGVIPVNSIKIKDQSGRVYKSISEVCRVTGHCKKYIKIHTELFSRLE